MVGTREARKPVGGLLCLPRQAVLPGPMGLLAPEVGSSENRWGPRPDSAGRQKTELSRNVDKAIQAEAPAGM